MSSSYTPPPRPDGYTTSTRAPAAGGPGASGTGGRPEVADRDVRPVRPRGHVRDDLGLLVLRLALATVMLAHGYARVALQGGIAGTQATFAQLGAPFPEVAAVLIIVLELVGGVAMVVGLFTVVVALCYAAAMAASVWYVHRAHGFFVAGNGYEFVGLVGVVAVVLAITGAGGISLDRAIFGAKRRRRVREAREAGV